MPQNKFAFKHPVIPPASPTCYHLPFLSIQLQQYSPFPHPQKVFLFFRSLMDNWCESDNTGDEKNDKKKEHLHFARANVCALHSVCKGGNQNGHMVK